MAVDGAPPDWADRFRAARKAADFSSSEKFALRVGASRRTALRWETGETLPSDDYRLVIAEISPELAALVSELPAEEDRRHDLSRRLDALCRNQEVIAATLERLTAGLEAVERRIGQLEQPRKRRSPRA